MTDVVFTEDLVLRSWIKAELIQLWHNLYEAHRWTIGNDGQPDRSRPWSMAADSFAERIKTASALVGPVDWNEAIGMSKIIDGWYVWAVEKIGIPGTVLPTEDDIAACQALQNGYR